MSASDKPAGEPWWSEYKGFAFPLLVIAAGFASHGIFTVVNFRQGLTFGTDQWSSVVFGSLCLAVDLIGVGMCTALSGRLRANGNWWPARKMMGVVYMSAAFSLLMFYGYNAAERIEPTKQDVAANVAAGAAQERSEKATAKARMGHIEFLQKQAVKAGERARNTDLSRRDRKEALAQQELYLKQAGDASFKPVKVEAAPIVKDRDAMAVVLASRIGWKVGSVQEALGTFAAALLMLITITTIRYGFQILPRPTVTDRPQPPISLEPSNDVSAWFLPRLRHLDAKRDDTEYMEQVLQWVKVGTVKSTGAKEKARDLYDHYQKYAVGFGYEPASIAMWGRCLKDLNEQGRISWPKKAGNGGIRYMGRARDNTQPWAREYEHPMQAMTARPKLVANGGATVGAL